ncbi:hypothetical protein N0V93_000882 [Gnomoniopsis smithogilvyi]|uniref:Methyltransferase domain-containing protein n=1 Tax=Gnomoniopsis smithogilvyi TaxID=1191159 RepID=A0A9W8Z2H5_9PEZI|nr:hypothetical protein N0V93_000882 [Gnomoniopsis smithogilvyi]
MSAQFGLETQKESAQRMYNVRASKYEDSWHPQYSRRFIAHAPLKPGDRVLSLCCGTGLDAFLAAEIVGEEGEVVGVDVSSGMLEQLRQRQEREAQVGSRIKIIQHDVTDLDSLAGEGVEKASFDAILCSCAFVLFNDPSTVVAHWKEYIKPGGVLVIDITHEYNLRSGIVLETVAKGMGIKYPSNREWIKSQESFKSILEAQGLHIESIDLLENISGSGRQFHSIQGADSHYDSIVNSSLTRLSASEEFKSIAKPLFREAWKNAAVNGKVEDSDALYLYVARKPEERLS